MCISQGLRALTQIIGSSVSLFFISPKLTIITTLVVPLLVAAGQCHNIHLYSNLDCFLLNFDAWICLGSVLGAILRIYSKTAQWQVWTGLGDSEKMPFFLFVSLYGFKVAKSTAVADEAINNVRTVRAFAMEDTEIE
jgi:ATP-binding cassette subfamily B (MDR/TAP) protein 8